MDPFLSFRGDDDQDYVLEGYREIRDDPESDVRGILNDTTTLLTTLLNGVRVAKDFRQSWDFAEWKEECS
jgi:hypothetical protein